MTHSPPVPPANQSPYPIQEKPHVAHAAPSPAPKQKRDEPAAGRLILGAALGIGAAVLVGGALLAGLGGRGTPAPTKKTKGPASPK